MAGRMQRSFMNLGPGTIGIMFELYWDNGKENGNYRDYGGLRDFMEPFRSPSMSLAV